MTPANISRVTTILVVVLHLGEDDACRFAIFPILCFIIDKKTGVSPDYEIYGQIPGLIALKNPENRLHH
jgi:hypothetical protein